MSQQQASAEERATLDEELTAASTGMSTAAKLAAQEEEQVYKNHKFLGELSDSGLDPDLKADLGPLLADAFVTANRDVEAYRRFIKWINANEAERDIVRHDPGQHIKQRPTAMAIAQDLHLLERPWEEWKPAYTSEKRANHRRGYRAVTAFQSLGAGGTGIETVGTVQTSTEVNRSVEGEKSTREKLQGIYK